MEVGKINSRSTGQHNGNRELRKGMKTVADASRKCPPNT